MSPSPGDERRTAPTVEDGRVGDDDRGRRVSLAPYAQVAFVVLALALITAIHFVTDPTTEGGRRLLSFYGKLYYVPVIYAALVFGWRGGLVTSGAASLLYGLHSWFTLNGLQGVDLDHVLEAVMFVVVGVLFGWFRDTNSAKTRELERVGIQLEDAYRTLEQRTIHLANIQDRTQTILRSIAAGVVTVGTDGSVMTANNAAERILGMPEAEMMRQSLDTLLADGGALSENLRRILAEPIPRIVAEAQGRTRDGRFLHLAVSMGRIRDVGGQVLGAVVTFDDVSELRALMEHVIQTDRLAAMGELTAGVAHEVRNPLGIIRASVQLAEDSRDDPARVEAATRVIKQEIDRLDRVITALLEFGRPSAPTLRPTDIRDAVRDVALLTRRFAADADVQLVVQCEAGVPPVSADADQMKQVLVNLVSNAVQAMESSGGTITIRVWAERKSVLFSVADDGPGIPAEELPRVFEPFHSTREEGTGLGLTIVQRIVRQHRGEISVESALGQGTTFTVTLPALSVKGELA